MRYLARAVDEPLADLLGGMGGVVIEGPRACGKTSTGLQHARSSVRLDSSPQLIDLASLAPSELLRGDTPRLVDEWQLAPTLWNVIRHEIDDRQMKGQFILSGSATPQDDVIRHEIDDRQMKGQFILSGSATPQDDVIRHSGAGRIGRIRMRPMSLTEAQRSSDQVSLAGLAHAGTVSGTSPLSYADLAAEAVRGGWPALLSASSRAAIAFNRSYLEDLRSTDIPLATGTRHDPGRMRRLFESLARNIASTVTTHHLAKDVSADGGGLSPDTAHTYLDALSRIFLLEELPAWSVALRSRSRLRTVPKRYLAEPALACAALGIGIDRLAADPEYFGQVFEAMAIRDLRSLASVDLGQVYYYRDNTNLEVDAIVEYPDGRWAAIEIKLGSKWIPQGESNLLTLAGQRVDVTRVGAPAFLAVITGTEYAYTLPSGVHVIPLACLRR